MGHVSSSRGYFSSIVGISVNEDSCHMIGNWETDGSTGEAVIQMSQMNDLAITGESRLSGNDPFVAVCISSSESRDNQGHGLNSGD